MSTAGTARLATAEFVGTTVVVIGGPGLAILAGDELGTLGIAMGFGLSVAIVIGALGAVANPMFSLALWMSRAISGREAIADVIGQIAGGVFGAAIVYALADTTRFTRGTNGWEPAHAADVGVDVGIHLTGFSSLGVVVAAEFVLAIIVVTVLLSAVALDRGPGVVAIYTGAAVTVATMILLPISGGGLNPARSLGIAVFADTDPNALGQVWVFVIVPIVAALAGVIVWLVIDEATLDDTVFDDTFVDDAVDAVRGDRDD